MELAEVGLGVVEVDEELGRAQTGIFEMGTPMDFQGAMVVVEEEEYLEVRKVMLAGFLRGTVVRVHHLVEAVVAGIETVRLEVTLNGPHAGRMSDTVVQAVGTRSNAREQGVATGGLPLMT